MPGVGGVVGLVDFGADAAAVTDRVTVARGPRPNVPKIAQWSRRRGPALCLMWQPGREGMLG
jgi:hypothetical protein